MTASTILIPAPTPRHRGIFPGELHITLGSHSSDGGRTNHPGGLAIRLMHANCHEGTVTVATSGVCELIAKNGLPVLLVAGEPTGDGPVDIAGLRTLAGFTGLALARELLGYMRGLLDRYSGEQYLGQVVRFADPAGYNDLICGLAAEFLAAARDDTLAGLIADVHANSTLQTVWYQSNRPAAGEDPAGYRAEAGEFQQLTSAWLHAAQHQLAAA